MARVDNDLFSTPERLLQLQEAKAGGEIILDHHAAPLDERQKMGTVGAVALDLAGNLAAATSTGGMTNKLPGRVGDSPLPGAGCYANNASVAVSCTGTGEVFMRTLAAYDIAALMEYGQLSLLFRLRAGGDGETAGSRRQRRADSRRSRRQRRFYRLTVKACTAPGAMPAIRRPLAFIANRTRERASVANSRNRYLRSAGGAQPERGVPPAGCAGGAGRASAFPSACAAARRWR